MFSNNQSGRSPVATGTGVARSRPRRMSLWATAVATLGLGLGLSAPANADDSDDSDVVAPVIITGGPLIEIPGTIQLPAGSVPLPAGAYPDPAAPPVKIQGEPRPPTFVVNPNNGSVGVTWPHGVSESESYRTPNGKWVFIDNLQRIWVYDTASSTTERVSARPPKLTANSPTHAQPSTCAYQFLGCK
ncbi:hypothetical protein MINS_19580 [Mycolicibacterium insubricum]|nr:hypothetical protein MINS_19580 [Mycolicibacterium insubricum]